MKKLFTLLGAIAIMALVLISNSLSASAVTEIQKKCNDKVFVVTHETVADQVDVFLVTDHLEFMREPISFPKFGIIEDYPVRFQKPVLNDPYLCRSQRWISENNSLVNWRLYKSGQLTHYLSTRVITC